MRAQFTADVDDSVSIGGEEPFFTLRDFRTRKTRFPIRSIAVSNLRLVRADIENQRQGLLHERQIFAQEIRVLVFHLGALSRDRLVLLQAFFERLLNRPGGKRDVEGNQTFLGAEDKAKLGLARGNVLERREKSGDGLSLHLDKDAPLRQSEKNLFGDLTREGRGNQLTVDVRIEAIHTAGVPPRNDGDCACNVVDFPQILS